MCVDLCTCNISFKPSSASKQTFSNTDDMKLSVNVIRQLLLKLMVGLGFEVVVRMLVCGFVYRKKNKKTLWLETIVLPLFNKDSLTPHSRVCSVHSCPDVCSCWRQAGQQGSDSCLVDSQWTQPTVEIQLHLTTSL